MKKLLKPLFSHCKKCESVGYGHPEDCDEEGTMSRASSEDRATMARANIRKSGFSKGCGERVELV